LPYEFERDIEPELLLDSPIVPSEELEGDIGMPKRILLCKPTRNQRA
jgi:hypothetical protein